MIISHAHKFIWCFPVGHTASTSIMFSILGLHDDAAYIPRPFQEEVETSNWTPDGALSDYSDDHEVLKIFADLKAVELRPRNFPLPKFLEKHSKASSLLDEGFDKKKFDSYLKIAVCRSPYTWMAAQMKKNKNIKLLNALEINAYMKRSNWWGYPQKNPQSFLLENIDKIIKFESLEEEFNQLKVGSDAIIPPHITLNRVVKTYETHRETFSMGSGKVYNHHASFRKSGIHRINEIFHEDFIKLGYDKLVPEDFEW